MKKINGMDFLKASELARQAAVSPSTIHYYVREGLLTPPVRTSRNMAFYSPECVQEILYIQELKTKQYLPLSAIKLLIKARQNGQAAGHQLEMRVLLEKLFLPVEKEAASRRFTMSELASASGLPEAELRRIESIGLLDPETSENGAYYDDIDLRIANLCASLAAMGVKPSDLSVFREYTQVIKSQIQELHRLLHRMPDHDSIQVNELANVFKDLKALIDLRAFRNEAEHGDKVFSLKKEGSLLH